MSEKKGVALNIDYTIDPDTFRHYMNGTCNVMHCHHYAVLYTQLANDAVGYDGIKHLLDTSEDVFYELLDRYFQDHQIRSIEDRLEIAQQYWKKAGMGCIEFTCAGKYEVIAEMEFSHIDEGWLKKLGPNDKPVNYFTQGFVSAVAALVNEKPSRSYQTKETKSLVCGDEKSQFIAVLV